MRLLDECLTLTRRLKELEEQILELEAAMLSPKSQIITGMPRSGGLVISKADEQIIRLERLRERKSRVAKKRETLWGEAVAIFQQNNIKNEHINLVRYRFYCGIQWKQCCALMCKEYPDQQWNINKTFRVYRQILIKCR